MTDPRGRPAPEGGWNGWAARGASGSAGPGIVAFLRLARRPAARGPNPSPLRPAVRGQPDPARSPCRAGRRRRLGLRRRPMLRRQATVEAARARRAACVHDIRKPP